MCCAFIDKGSHSGNMYIYINIYICGRNCRTKVMLVVQIFC